jgi:hypothetical protein
MKSHYTDLIPVRDELARSLADSPGFDSVGITKTEQGGEFALSVFLTEPGYSTAKLPASYNGYQVVRKKATEFVPH